MGNWIDPVLYTLLLAAVIALGIYCYWLRQKAKADASRWRRTAEQRYKEGRSEASEMLRSAVDQIADDKVRLGAMSERDLMTEAMLALGSLARRMDRMEDCLHSFSRFDEAMEQINEQAEFLAENARTLKIQMDQAGEESAAFCRSAADAVEAVDGLSDACGQSGRLMTDLSGQIRSLEEISGVFSGFESQLREAVDRVNQLLRQSMDNPSAVLAQMDSRISAVHEQLQNLSEGLNLMAESLEGVQETLDSASTRDRQTAPDACTE